MQHGISIEITREIPSGFSAQKEIVRVRRPIAKDLFGLDFVSPVNQMKSWATLISRITNLSEQEIEQLPVNEYLKLQNKLNEFFT